MNREAAERVAAMAPARYPAGDISVTGTSGGAVIDVRDGKTYALRLTVADENSPILSLFGLFPPE